MRQYNTVHVVTELRESIKKLNIYPAYAALNVPAWKIFERKKIQNIFRATLVWIWGECLIARNPEHAKTVYYCAQVHLDQKSVKKYFLYRQWHAVCSDSTNTGPAGPDISRVAQQIIMKYGTMDKDNPRKHYSETEKTITKYLKAAYEHFDRTIKDADLSGAEAWLRAESLRLLRVVEMRGQDMIYRV